MAGRAETNAGSPDQSMSLQRETPLAEHSRRAFPRLRDRGHSTARSIGKRLLPLPSGPARNLSESRSISTLIRSSRSASRATKRWSSYLPPDETEPLHTPLMNHGVCGGGGSGKGSSRPQNLPVAPWEADTGILQATHNISQWKNARFSGYWRSVSYTHLTLPTNREV